MRRSIVPLLLQLLAAGAAVLVLLVPLVSGSFCDSRAAARQTPGSEPPLYVGALGYKGEEALFRQWNATFAT